MPRPIKDGLDYFPLDVQNDDKLDLIEAEFGIQGWAIIIKLYQRIYKNSYFTKWTENELLLFKKAVNVDINLINDVINKALERDIFDTSLFKKYQILTSNGIQKRYIEITARRKHVSMISEYVLDSINEYINEHNVSINLIDSCKSTQSKVKESKGKESKENIYMQKSEKFRNEVTAFVKDNPKYESVMEEFISYWTEPNKSKTRIRYDNETNFDLGRRLGTFLKNQKRFPGSKQSTKEINTEVLNNLRGKLK
jgi:hypothetical protein